MNHDAIRDAAIDRDTIPKSQWWLSPKPPPPTPISWMQQLRDQRRQQWTISDPKWRDQAECAGTPTDVFFPERGEDTRPAKAICATCLVADDCLADAIIQGEHFGIRGGLTVKERNKLRDRLCGDQCGTVAGYMRHRRQNDTACHHCMDAWRQRSQQNRNGTR